MNNEITESELLALYLKLDAYNEQLCFSIHRKTALTNLKKVINKTLDKYSSLNHNNKIITLSEKWPTLLVRSLTLYGAIAGMTCLFLSHPIGIALALAVVSVYMIKKIFSGPSKKEQRIAIRHTLLTAKEKILSMAGFKSTNVTQNKTLDLSLPKPSIGGLLRNTVSVAADAISIYSGVLGLLGIAFVVSNPAGLIVGLSIATLVTVGFSFFRQSYRAQMMKAETKLMSWQYQQKWREQKYLSTMRFFSSGRRKMLDNLNVDSCVSSGLHIHHDGLQL